MLVRPTGRVYFSVVRGRTRGRSRSTARKLGDHDRGEGGLDPGQHDAREDPELGGAVEAGGLLEVAGEPAEERGEGEDRERDAGRGGHEHESEAGVDDAKETEQVRRSERRRACSLGRPDVSP